MPAEAVHLTALREALARPGASPALAALVAREPDAARLGAVLIDFPYFARFPEQVLRYVLGITPRHAPWGVRLHEEGPIGAIARLLEAARRDRDEPLAALAIGLASHAALDRMLHPLVNALARENGMRRGLSRMSAHMEVEKYQSICFHEVALGRDYMGTPTLARYIDLALAPALGRHPLGERYRRALGETFGAEVPARALGAWGRGYRSFTRLLGSPLGRTIAPEREKERARPRFLFGPWGTFAEQVERAIARSLPVLESAHAVYACADRDLDLARARFALWLPAGTIDALGDDVDLARPYDVERFLPDPPPVGSP